MNQRSVLERELRTVQGSFVSGEDMCLVLFIGRVVCPFGTVAGSFKHFAGVGLSLLRGVLI
jgi:hypothetical protein